MEANKEVMEHDEMPSSVENYEDIPNVVWRERINIIFGHHYFYLVMIISGVGGTMVKGLVMVGRELRQQPWTNLHLSRL